MHVEDAMIFENSLASSLTPNSPNGHTDSKPDSDKLAKDPETDFCDEKSEEIDLEVLQPLIVIQPA